MAELIISLMMVTMQVRGTQSHYAEAQAQVNRASVRSFSLKLTA